ncbi:MAG: T9SS type A sorting domain-containing protein [Saprospiraceae bacterium]|nr:T9SS type A sorting domain-containing protein [Saprospiraceae bacterium]
MKYKYFIPQLLFAFAFLFLPFETVTAQGEFCASALVIAEGTHSADGPISGNGASASGCFGAVAVHADWYMFTPTSTGDMTISSCIDNVDTRVSVYTGTCGSLVCVASDDDGCGAQFQSTLTTPVTSGTTYYIEWDNRWTSAGFNFTLDVLSCEPLTVGNALSDQTPCPASSRVTFDVSDLGSSTDWIVTNDAGGTNPSNITSTGTGFQITDIPGSGNITVTFTSVSDPTCTLDLLPIQFGCPPANDLCADKISITAGSIGGTSIGSTGTGSPAACIVPPGSNGVWYSYESLGPETITMDVCVASFDTKMNVYSGSCAGLTCVAGNDDDAGVGGANVCGGGLQSSVSFESTATAGSPVTYLIYISGFGTSTGTFTLTLATSPLPLELLSFYGKEKENGNLISWEASSEINVDYHSLERSSDGVSDWSEITRIASQGEQGLLTAYSYLDERPLSKSYYRLRSIDFDRSENVSDLISIERKASAFTISKAFPNPGKESVLVQFNLPENRLVEFRILDIRGNLLSRGAQTGSAGTNNLPIDLINLSPGTYILLLNDGYSNITQRILKH